MQRLCDKCSVLEFAWSIFRVWYSTSLYPTFTLTSDTRRNNGYVVYPAYSVLSSHVDGEVCTTTSVGPITLPTPYTATFDVGQDQHSAIASGHSALVASLTSNYHNISRNPPCTPGKLQAVGKNYLPSLAVTIATTVPLGVIFLISIGIYLGRKALSKEALSRRRSRLLSSDKAFLSHKPELAGDSSWQEIGGTPIQKPELAGDDSNVVEIAASERRAELIADIDTHEMAAADLGSEKQSPQRVHLASESRGASALGELGAGETAKELPARSP
ncbi:uncharacterized protein KY384_004799 [Bacidia gigantensis]|uniref:uncharacterized protein n=1 Tax=Bacidia gigantensis TaxID=2732470 RepID=UPI001D05B3D5|nr:uncharacterized protein KY384_004799 [Bacidia gigantensis]KAG8530297.1 hypothetical protein KY384_004799 [Bacidia gigantensis]